VIVVKKVVSIMVGAVVILGALLHENMYDGKSAPVM